MIDALENDLRTAARFNGLATIYVGAVHDLRAPLNSMVVYLELLKQSVRRVAQNDGESAEVIQQRKYIEVIQLEINRLSSYVQALLDLTAPAKNSAGELDIVQGLNDIAGLIRVQAKLQGVALDWQLPDRPILLNCKQVQLRQAFLNLIINALEAMPSGGVLTVRADSQNGVIAIEVCDNGAGIPEALQPRVFDLHFTTKETHTGIGLYVARSVVEEHGGTLEVHSKPGCGACFRVCIPQNGKVDETSRALSGQ